MWLALSLSVVLSAADAPVKQEVEPPGREYSVLVPVLENWMVNFALLGIANLIPQEEFARISLDTIASNLDGRQPWRFDKDHIITNQFGHTYHGAMFFTSARSSGLNFWWSALFPVTSSLFWEIALESEAPSFNDQITTSIAGVLVGEALHRLSLLFDDYDNVPAKIMSFIASPLGFANRWMFDRRFDAHDVRRKPRYYAEVHAGALATNVSTGERWFPMARIRAELIYGLPSDPELDTHVPFSHFAANLGFAFPGPMSAGHFDIRGLIYGGRFASPSQTVRGFAGVYGQYDLSLMSGFRVSSVGVGVGGVMQVKLAEQVHLEVTTIVSGVPIGAAGERPAPADSARDYAFGSGGQLFAQLRLVRQPTGALGVTVRSWLLRGSYDDGFATTEMVTMIQPTFSVRLTNHFLLTFEVPITSRRSEVADGSTVNLGVTGLQATLGFTTDATFGFERAVRVP
ncbi:MAG: hypothetical protein DI536_09520 [Archangium gephyra]|uniref:DUF3943 domain-containing protein n=1 Tax=Archangium gephyra TaxID=48 RepID=A0A2W5TR37_9BACT|nr:MAG: hypothetical protein DI536_09520 [Archangium gephyra]